MIIDAHSHLMDQRLCEKVGMELPPNMLDPDALVEEQEGAGIDLSIISGPRLMERAVDENNMDPVEIARQYNDFVAELATHHQNTFVGLGACYPFAGDQMHREMERAVRDLGLRGFIISPTCADEFIDSPKAFPFFEVCAELDAVVFVHNRDSCLACEHMQDHRLTELVGRPNEMGLLAARLIFSGLMERLPNLKLLLGRLGGSITLYAGRIQQGWETRHTRKDGPPWGSDNLTNSFMDSLCRIHVDTQTYHPPAITCAVETLGAERVLFGTDYPPVPRSRAASIEDVRNTALPGEQIAMILSGNASRLFKLPTEN
jgi:aminocarboxymuconate-semialdehyde decarboxylase